MPTFMVISRHAPESCWMFNERTRQVHVNLVSKLESLLKKYKVTLLGCWFDLPGHTLYEFYDAPSGEVFEMMSREPEILQWSSFNTMEIKMVVGLEDVKRMLKPQG
jgi:hypothetical protein